MNDASLESALERAEFAVRRIERSLDQRSSRNSAPERDEVLRAKVREAVAELDQLIREAAE